uniref:Tail tape measure protein n=1 Tax=viral metagenome TaxID=1070528 RepID=A0A6M3Y046_9ZZZZ
MIDWVVNQLIRLWDALASWATAIYDTVAGWIDDVYSWAATVANELYSYIKTVISDVRSWARATFAEIGEIANTIINYITNTYQTITNNISNVINNISNYITETYETIVNNISNTYNTIVNNITNVIGLTVENLVEWFRGVGGATMSWVEGLFVKAEDVWNTITGNIEEWWKPKAQSIQKTIDTSWAKWDTLLNNLDTIKNDIWSFFTDPLHFLLKLWSWDTILGWTAPFFEAAGGTEEARDEEYAKVPKLEDDITTQALILKDKALTASQPQAEIIDEAIAKIQAQVLTEIS